MAFSQAGQYGPEALLDSAGNALLGASVSAPAGYTATVDQYANLTVTGPPAASVPVVVTRAGGVAFTVNVPVAPAVTELESVRDLALRTRKGPTSNTPLKLTATTVPASAYAVGTDGLVYGNPNNGSNRIVRTGDGFATTTGTGQRFSDLGDSGDLVYADRLAEGFVAIVRDGGGGNPARVYFSTAYESGFTKKLDISGVAPLSISKPVGTVNGTVWLVGEYTLGVATTARLWLSRDGGQTWTVVRTRTQTDASRNNHWHGSCFDLLDPVTGTGRIWASAGDGPHNLWSYSDDWGSTWVDVPSGTGAGPDEPGLSPYNHPTLIIACKDRLCVTPDGNVGNIGIWSTDKTTGLMGVAYEAAVTMPFRQFARAPYGQGGTNGDEVYVLFPPASGLDETGQVVIAGTGDGGDSWHTLARIPASSTDLWFNGIVGPDSAGRLYTSAKRNGVWTGFTAAKPTFSPRQLPEAKAIESPVSRSVALVAADATAVNTTAETTLASLPIPKTVQPGDVLRFVAYGDALMNTASPVTYTFRFYVGNTAISTNASSYSVGANRRRWSVTVDVLVVSVDADQRIGLQLYMTGGTVNEATYSTATASGTGYKAVTEVLSTGKNARLSVQMGTADPLADAVLHMASLQVAKFA